MIKKFCAAFCAALSLLFLAAPAYALPDGQMTYKYNAYNNITTATTVTVKANAGLVAAFCVNTVGTTSTLVIWDSLTASGNKVGTWTTVAVGCYVLDVATRIGITVVTTGAPAADITVFFR